MIMIRINGCGAPLRTSLKHDPETCPVASGGGGHRFRNRSRSTPTTKEGTERGRLSAFHSTALARGTFVPKALLQATLPGTRQERSILYGRPNRGAETLRGCTGVTRPRLSQSSESTSRAGHSAGRLMPGTARERIVTPPAGTALAPPPGNTSRRRPVSELDSLLFVTEMRTGVKRAVSLSVTPPRSSYAGLTRLHGHRVRFGLGTSRFGGAKARVSMPTYRVVFGN